MSGRSPNQRANPNGLRAQRKIPTASARPLRSTLIRHAHGRFGAGGLRRTTFGPQRAQPPRTAGTAPRRGLINRASTGRGHFPTRLSPAGRATTWTAQPGGQPHNRSSLGASTASRRGDRARSRLRNGLSTQAGYPQKTSSTTHEMSRKLIHQRGDLSTSGRNRFVPTLSTPIHRRPQVVIPSGG
jgi:hypothetical protein